MPYTAYLPSSTVTLLDLDEVAEVLNVSRKTAYRYCRDGKLPSNSVSGRTMVSNYNYSYSFSFSTSYVSSK